MKQKQLGIANTNMGPYDEDNPNLGVRIPVSVPGEELLWAPRTQFPWVIFFHK